MRNPVRMGVGVLRRAVDAVDRLSRGAQLSGMTVEVDASARLRAGGVTPQPSCSLVIGAGNPARVIRTLGEHER